MAGIENEAFALNEELQTIQYTKPEIIEIKKDPEENIGIVLDNGVELPHSETHDGISVSCILPGSPADGKLHPGDLILSVNGCPVSMCAKDVAIKLLRECSEKDEVQLTIRKLAHPQNTTSQEVNK